MQKKLEIIGFNIESCITAQDAGANRIELCASPGEGGTTPSYAPIEAARTVLTIDLYVMIRPRGGDFLYTAAEFETMQSDIKICKKLNCDGVVLGILDENGEVDTARCRQLIDLAYPMEVTFHRAFDRVRDPFKALNDIIELGCERILTSGLRKAATEAVELLSQLVEKAGEEIIIMPGSGVKSGNLIHLMQKTGAREFHSSASEKKPSGMKFVNDQLTEDLQYVGVNADEVRKMAEILADSSL